MLSRMRNRRWVSYAVGLVGVTAAWAARTTFDPLLGDHASFSFFYLAVSLAAWLGGIRPAIVTAIVGCLVGNYFFTEPHGSFQISSYEEFISLLIFISVSLIIGLLSESSLLALQRAKAAEQTKDHFIATLAHELRSPLSVIYYANALNRSSGFEKGKEHSDAIENQVKQLDTMVQDLLDISRVAQGKMRVNPQHVNAAEVLLGAIEKAKPLIESRGHALGVELPSEPVRLIADRIRMEQVLGNLLINAAKYTPDGGRIVASLHTEADSAVFSVRDNGFGIPEKMLPRIFDLYVQVDGESKHSAGGLGIGLTLVRKLVELHGGSVQVRSEGRNRGSEFVVTLPLDDSSRPSAEHPLTAVSA